MEKGKRLLTVIAAVAIVVGVIVGGVLVFNWVTGSSDKKDDGGDGGDIPNGTANKPPIARLWISNTSLEVGKVFALSGLNSTDPDGGNETYNGITTYIFYYGDGNRQEGATSNASYSYDEPGNYTITLRVFDTDGAYDEESVDVKVVWQDLNIAPNQAILRADPQAGFLNTTWEYSWPVKSDAKRMELTVSVLGLAPLEMEANRVNVTLLDPLGRVMDNETMEAFGNDEVTWEFGSQDLIETGDYTIIAVCSRGSAIVTLTGTVEYA